MKGKLSSHFRSALAGLALIAASVLISSDIGATPPERPAQDRNNNSQQKDLSRTIKADVGSAGAPLLLCIGLHIEPFGAAVSELAGKTAAENANRNDKVGDYNQLPFLTRHVKDIGELAAVVEKHGGKMTVQAQTPFTSQCVKNNLTVLADLAKKGNEIGLHFHEDAHLGRMCEKLQAYTWTAVMKEEIEQIKQAAGANVSVRYFSGGNNYPNLLTAASCAGLSVMSDHKNPHTQKTVDALLSIWPWRPAGGPNPDDMSAFAKNDPSGKIIYLPDGIFPDSDFKARKANGDAAFLDALTEGLEKSLTAARSDRVNVFHITLHPSELQGGPKDIPYELVDKWLTSVVDPLVKSGKVKWATFSQMADAYAAWEKSGKPTGGTTTTAPASATSPAEKAQSAAPAKPIMTFAINVHDVVNSSDSADTLVKLIAIFKKYKVKGDFYLTAPMTELFAANRPDVIKALKESGMCISYHYRPPHPAYVGFNDKLTGLSDEQLAATLLDYETYQLDLATGDVNKSKPGGYAYVKDVFGSAPVCVSAQTDDRRIRSAMHKIYKQMGAKVAVMYHETGTKIDTPLDYIDGLVIRPSDFSITRWKSTNLRKDDESFWWNHMTGPAAGDFNPCAKLRQMLSEWKAQRQPFVTALIHDDNFYRRGGTPWMGRYYPDGDKTKVKLTPPYDLSAADPSKPRPLADQQAILKCYEEMVAYAAANMTVMTSADIAAMAERK